ncbi:MAG: DMT family transporter [Woeseiaceae bacterium]|nr:DMT family transporter [Woeseiaceae bacterium]
MIDKKDHLDVLAVSTVLILCMSWGVQQVVIKLTLVDISPVMQAAFRSIGAMVILTGWALIRRDPLFVRDGTLWWGIAAGIFFTVEFVLIFWGLEFTNASRSVIFLFCSPFVVALGSQWFVPGERLNRLQFAGLGIAFLGIIIAFGESMTLPTKTMLVGDAMLIGAAIFWGAATVVVKAGPLATISPTRTLLYQLAVSALILPVASWSLGEPGVIRWSTFAIVSVVYQTIWVVAITYLAWFWLIRYYPAPKIASFTFLTPIFGVFAGWLILDEPLTIALLVALMFVATGVWLVNRQEKGDG